MPSDFGDESGEKLFDWMLQVGEDAGEAAIRASAEKLAAAFRNARGQAGEAVNEAEEEAGQGREWARLNMHEFSQLPEYDTIKQIIDERLDEEAVKHAFADVGGREYLVFKVEQAPAVASTFEQLEKETVGGVDRAARHLRDARGRVQEMARDKEPLKDRALAAREASAAKRAAEKTAEREMNRAQGRAK